MRYYIVYIFAADKKQKWILINFSLHFVIVLFMFLFLISSYYLVIARLVAIISCYFIYYLYLFEYLYYWWKKISMVNSTILLFLFYSF